ncbi:ricin B lectin domain-containing protein [Gongronella butleri]|nr:ricin B lectin domain-containing protein [Gongronella butleri]
MSTPVDHFPDGFFFMRCKKKALAVDVRDGAMVNDAPLIIWPQKLVDSINQLWMHEEGFLINKKSGLVVDIRGGDIKRDKAIIQYARKPGLAHNQRWQYQDGYIASQAAPHLVLDIRGGDFKESNALFLNTKDPNSQTQQWLIQPFENEKSNEDLALLRPSPNQRNSAFPRPEDLCDSYRLVYMEKQPAQDLTANQIAGALAFKALKVYIDAQKKEGRPIVGPDARKEIETQVKKLAQEENIQDQQLLYAADQAALGYYAREYEG